MKEWKSFILHQQNTSVDIWWSLLQKDEFFHEQLCNSFTRKIYTQESVDFSIYMIQLLKILF